MAPLSAATKEFERAYLIHTLAEFDGQKAKAADSLGISRKNLWEKLRAHGISVPRDGDTALTRGDEPSPPERRPQPAVTTEAPNLSGAHGYGILETMAELPFLIVEDDPRLPHLLGTFMRTPGWRPLCAASGAEALAHFDERQEAPVVALVGMGLPDTDGVALIRQLVALRPAPPRHRVDRPHGRGPHLGGHSRRRARLPLQRGPGSGLGGGAQRSGRSWRTNVPARCATPAGGTSTAASDRGCPDRRPALTERERRVIEQLARGLSYDQVALVLDISANTVRSYVRTIYEKLCVCSKTEAVLAAVRLGIIAAAG